MSSSKDLVFASFKSQTRVFSLVSKTCFSFLPSFPLLSLLVVPDQPQLVLLTFMLWGKLLLHAGTGSFISFLTYSFATRSAASSIYASIASTE